MYVPPVIHEIIEIESRTPAKEIKGNQTKIKRNQRKSHDIKGNQWKSKGIKGNQRKP